MAFGVDLEGWCGNNKRCILRSECEDVGSYGEEFGFCMFAAWCLQMKAQRSLKRVVNRFRSNVCQKTFSLAPLRRNASAKPLQLWLAEVRARTGGTPQRLTCGLMIYAELSLTSWRSSGERTKLTVCGWTGVSLCSTSGLQVQTRPALLDHASRWRAYTYLRGPPRGVYRCGRHLHAAIGPWTLLCACVQRARL